MRHFKFAVALAATLVLGHQAADAAGVGDIHFFKSYGCLNWDNPGYPSASFDSHVTTSANCTFGLNCPNDALRSVLIYPGVAPGTIIKVSDSPKGSTKDDWAQIVIKKVEEDHKDSLGRAHGMCIVSFETTRSGANYEIYYHRKNGLDGKVSLVRITPAKLR